MIKKLFAGCLLFSAGMFVVLSAQTAHAMPGKWYDEIMYANDNNTKIPLETKFNVTFDDKAMTVRIRMKDPYVQDLKALPKGVDNVWPKGESIEIFLDPGRSCGNYQQIAIGANNDRWDKRWLKKIKTDWTSKTEITKDGWNVTVRIPYSDPGMMKPQLGDIWGFNICRNVKNPKNNGRYFSTWAHVGAVFNRPEKFGMLVFGDPDGAKKAMREKVRTELKKLVAELQRKGYDSYFAGQIRTIEENGTEIDIRDIREELLVLEKWKGLHAK